MRLARRWRPAADAGGHYRNLPSPHSHRSCLADGCSPARGCSGAAVPLLDGRRLLRSPGKRSQLIPCRSRGRLRMASATHFRRSDRRGWLAAWRITQNEVGRAESLRPFSGCAARRRAPRRRPPSDGTAPRRHRDARAGGGTSGPRRDAASRASSVRKTNRRRSDRRRHRFATDVRITRVAQPILAAASGLPEPKPPS